MFRFVHFFHVDNCLFVAFTQWNGLLKLFHLCAVLLLRAYLRFFVISEWSFGR